ncbi:MAG: metallophosphoesterase [Candidatus Fermentibacteraceae bacterium]|nr:metallophosphoesterase [Candidatus Fermentibacteraceae bacterium]MBN2607799.1 metallophosphoesterase [Candidatus Fermentibacteraceae bacterium]
MSALLLALLVSFPVRIAILGDRTGSPDDAEFGIAVDAILEMSPDLVLSVGDFVEGNGDVETAARDWEHILPTLCKLTDRFPFVFTPGNNDIWNAETEALWERYTGTRPSRIEELLGIKFVVWDSSIPDMLTSELVAEIDEFTSDMNGEEPWIFITHKPFWFMSYQDSAAVRELMDLMEERMPLAVIGGHIHLFAAWRENGILYVSAGPSGSAVPDPDPETGDFTQLGWMTVWPDSVAYSVVDARGVYPETINTGEEMDLAYRYRRELLDPRPLEQELESAILRLTPVEEVPRAISLEIEPGSWGLQPLRLDLEELSEAEDLVFTQDPAGSPYPSPVISVRLQYGARDRELSFRKHWQVLRRANAFLSQVRMDGAASEGEYRLPVNTYFADFDGQPSSIPRTWFQAATDGERLFLVMEMTDCPGDSEDYAGFILAAPDNSYLWLRIFHDGSTEARTLSSRWELLPWEAGLETAVSAGDSSWCAEISVDTSILQLFDGHAGVHVYRSAGGSFGTWVYPVEFDSATMGRVWLQVR